jgi:hypothetical protein
MKWWAVMGLDYSRSEEQIPGGGMVAGGTGIYTNDLPDTIGAL